MIKVKTNKLAQIPSFSNAKDVISFLQQPTLAIAETLTGILSSDISQYKLTAGHIVQSVIEGNLLTQLGRELEKYRTDGKVKENYFATNNNQASLLELLKFIDEGTPDEEMFRAAKAIFFSGIATEADKKQELLSYQLLLICKKLSSMDILILKTCYQMYVDDPAEHAGPTNDFGAWQSIISEEMGLPVPELVGAQDDKLVGLGLLSGRSLSDKSGVRQSREFRLTKLAIALCKQITDWP